MRVETALIVMLGINLFLFLGQVATDSINQEFGFNAENNNFYNYENSLIGSLDAGNYTLDESNIQDELPDAQSGNLVEQIGDFFTDMFQTLKNWLLDTTGLKYLVGIVNAVPHFLGSLGLPQAFVFGLSAFWHALTIFLIIAFIRGN